MYMLNTALWIEGSRTKPVDVKSLQEDVDDDFQIHLLYVHVKYCSRTQSIRG
jgi:hypothetical protein